jgi:hypothetical protein
MALTRKLLKGMGLTDEQVDTIIEAHSDTVDGLKAEANRYKSDAEKLADVQRELDGLKAKGDDGWKDKHDKVKKDFEDYKNAQTQKENKAAKEEAYRKLLKDCNISEKYIDDVLGIAKLDDLEMENGAFKDAENISNGIKEKFASFVATTTTVGANTATPPANSGSGNLTKADIYKKDDKGRYVMSTAERQKAIAENPNILN